MAFFFQQWMKSLKISFLLPYVLYGKASWGVKLFIVDLGSHKTRRVIKPWTMWETDKMNSNFSFKLLYPKERRQDFFEQAHAATRSARGQEAPEVQSDIPPWLGGKSKFSWVEQNNDIQARYPV